MSKPPETCFHLGLHRSLSGRSLQGLGDRRIAESFLGMHRQALAYDGSVYDFRLYDGAEMMSIQ